MIENRKTEISDIELEDFDEESLKTDEIFEQFKLALLQTDPTRLLGKFYTYCYEYVNFEFDESAHNIDEADDILRKVNILRDKLLDCLEESLSCTFDNIQTNTLEFQISASTMIDNIDYKVIIEVFPDSFDLEIK